MIVIKKLKKIDEVLKGGKLLPYKFKVKNNNVWLIDINLNDNVIFVEFIEINDVISIEFGERQNNDITYKLTNKNKSPINFFNTLSFLLKKFIAEQNPKIIRFCGDFQHRKFYDSLLKFSIKEINSLGYNLKTVEISNQKYYFLYNDEADIDDKIQYAIDNFEEDEDDNY